MKILLILLLACSLVACLSCGKGANTADTGDETPAWTVKVDANAITEDNAEKLADDIDKALDEL